MTNMSRTGRNGPSDDAVAELLAWLDGDEHALDNWADYSPDPVHGYIVGSYQDAYNDYIVYADGYEERFYIGD